MTRRSGTAFAIASEVSPMTRFERCIWSSTKNGPSVMAGVAMHCSEAMSVIIPEAGAPPAAPPLPAAGAPPVLGMPAAPPLPAAGAPAAAGGLPAAPLGAEPPLPAAELPAAAGAFPADPAAPLLVPLPAAPGAAPAAGALPGAAGAPDSPPVTGPPLEVSELHADAPSALAPQASAPSTFTDSRRRSRSACHFTSLCIPSPLHARRAVHDPRAQRPELSRIQSHTRRRHALAIAHATAGRRRRSARGLEVHPALVRLSGLDQVVLAVG